MTARRPYVAIVTCVAAALLGSWLGVRFFGATQAWPATLSDREFWDMYKALAELSTDRVEFLSCLFARPRPIGLRSDSTAQALLDAFRPVPCSEKLAKANLRAVFDRLERVQDSR
jgi:hypothetical protein